VKIRAARKKRFVDGAGFGKLAAKRSLRMSTNTSDPACATIGEAVVAHVNSGAESDRPLWDQHFDPGFTSVEGDGSAYEGIDAVQKKCDEWLAAHTIHSCVAEGPFVGAGGFAVRYAMDLEPNDGSWPRTRMTEIGVYTVNNGKVVREEFWYGPHG
jgi:hypothetical protein